MEEEKNIELLKTLKIYLENNMKWNHLIFSGFKVTATTQRDSSGDKNDS